MILKDTIIKSFYLLRNVNNSILLIKESINDKKESILRKTQNYLIIFFYFYFYFMFINLCNYHLI